MKHNWTQVCLLMTLFTVSACSSSSPSSTPSQNGTNPQNTDPSGERSQGSNGSSSGENSAVEGTGVGEIWECHSNHVEQAVMNCTSGRQVYIQEKRLIDAITRWGLNGESWSASLLRTRSFDRRIGLTSVEKKCLTDQFCKEIYK